MKTFKRLGLITFACLLGVIALGVTEGPVPGLSSVVPEAHAVVGRPLSPVSVAGATRRTVRRCAAGAYNC
jgi:hypothetical protein